MRAALNKEVIVLKLSSFSRYVKQNRRKNWRLGKHFLGIKNNAELNRESGLTLFLRKIHASKQKVTRTDRIDCCMIDGSDQSTTRNEGLMIWGQPRHLLETKSHETRKASYPSVS